MAMPAENLAVCNRVPTCTTVEKSICRDSTENCALGGACMAASGIMNSAILIHGSSGCGWMGRWARSDQAITNYTPLIATNLLEHNIIFGGKEKLANAAEFVLNSWKPKQLFIMMGCSGSLISDPIEEISRPLEAKYNTPIIVVDTAGFNGLAASGADIVFSSIVNRIARPVDKPDPLAVNLIGVFLGGGNNWVYDLDEIKRLLEAIGLRINCVLTCGTPREDIERFNEAKYNLFLTYEELPNLTYYLRENGGEKIGYDLPLPLGVSNTEDWLLGVARIFDREEKARQVIKEERKALRQLKFMYNATWLLNWVATKYAAVVGPATWVSSFAKFLYYDLAIFPQVLALTGESPESIERAKDNLKDLQKYFEPTILENALYIQILDTVLAANVEFVFGSTSDKSLFEGAGLPHLSVVGNQTVLGAFNFVPYPSVGMRGTLYLLSQMGRLLENTYHEVDKWKALAYRRRDE